MKGIFKATASFAAIALATGISGAAAAQDSAATDETAGTSQVEQIVVTGSRNPMKVLETSYGVTVLNQETRGAKKARLRQRLLWRTVSPLQQARLMVSWVFSCQQRQVAAPATHSPGLRHQAVGARCGAGDSGDSR